MLAQCRTHGYYRGELCPLCDEAGRFMMKDFEIDRVGRMMAGILRHFPERFNLSMDGRGWVDLDQFVEAIQDARPQWARWLRKQHIQALVETDEKGRYQIDGGMIRATYAHSVPVNLDDLPEANVDELFFPVAEEELDIVLETGLRPNDRNMIHLSASADKAYSAGRVHHPDPILLKVDVRKATQAGNFIFRAGKSVYVTDAVEPEFLTKVDDPELYAKLKEEADEEDARQKEAAAKAEAERAARGERREGGRDGGRDGGRRDGGDGGRDGGRGGDRRGGRDGGQGGQAFRGGGRGGERSGAAAAGAVSDDEEEAPAGQKKKDSEEE